MKTVQEEEERGSASLCLSSTKRPPRVLRDNAGSQKSLCVSELPQLFSKSDRRSSLLLLGRSGGSRYDNSSSGLASSGRSCKDEGMTRSIWSGIQGDRLFKTGSEHFCSMSGLTSKEGSGISDPAWLSKLLEGLKARSPCGWLLGPGCCGCCCCWGGGACRDGWGGPLWCSCCPDWLPGCGDACKLCCIWPCDWSLPAEWGICGERVQILRYTVIPDHVDGLEKGSAECLTSWKLNSSFGWWTYLGLKEYFRWIS